MKVKFILSSSNVLEMEWSLCLNHITVVLFFFFTCVASVSLTSIGGPRWQLIYAYRNSGVGVSSAQATWFASRLHKLYNYVVCFVKHLRSIVCCVKYCTLLSLLSILLIKLCKTTDCNADLYRGWTCDCCKILFSFQGINNILENIVSCRCSLVHGLLDLYDVHMKRRGAYI